MQPLADYDYELKEHNIAHKPAACRDHSKLMVIHRKTGDIEHRVFSDIVEYLHEGDVLVRNNSRVVPARIVGRKSSGGSVEFLLLREIEKDVWEVLCKPSKKLVPGNRVSFGAGLQAYITESKKDGMKLVRFIHEDNLLKQLETIGQVPLPPYIDRSKSGFMEGELRARYQTVYAKEDGSCAAPTAGLHFTEDLLRKLEQKGIRIADVTLHVGPGTFRPITTMDISDHVMHAEYYKVSQDTICVIETAKKTGSKIFAVGTTTTRVLETIADNIAGKNRENINGTTALFVTPGYKFRTIDGLVTNFHLPKSSLLVMISAFYNRDAVIRAYKIALQANYRFFSFGDAMMII